MTLEFDIYCSVVDNYGDAGVCWRLARQLAREHGARVTLLIDRPATLAAIAPGATAGSTLHGVRVRDWSAVGHSVDDGPGRSTYDDGTPSGCSHPRVIVSAFGCELPAPVRRRLAADAPQPRPLWVNLEYLSAEGWVEGCHGLASTKPGDGATEHFFYPGFTAATGGLLRESGLIRARGAFLADGGAHRWLAARGLAPVAGGRLVSLFCYPDAPVAEWLTLLAEAPAPTTVLVPEGVAAAQIEAAMGRQPEAPAGLATGGLATGGLATGGLATGGLPTGELATAGRATGGPVLQRGNLTLRRFALMSQDDYDRLLWSCDLNFVRGEDSWIRAHWAGRPFVWQPYLQADGAHHVKLDAFLQRFAGVAGPIDPAAAMMRAWSGREALAPAWRAFDAALTSDKLAAAASDDAAVAAGGPRDLPGKYARWNGFLEEQQDLCSALLEFCRNRL